MSSQTLAQYVDSEFLVLEVLEAPAHHRCCWMATRRQPAPVTNARPPSALCPLCRAATVAIITNDGRNIVGLLRGYDQATNLILDECHERVYSSKARQLQRRCLPAATAIGSIRARGVAESCRAGQQNAGHAGSQAPKPLIRQLTSPPARPLPVQAGVEQLVLGLYVVRGDNV